MTSPHKPTVGIWITVALAAVLGIYGAVAIRGILKPVPAFTFDLPN